MIVEIVPIPTLAFTKVHFYSVRLEGRAISEFKDFQIRMREKGYDPELAEINRYINNIGKRFGATTNQFRHEGAADGLPPPYHPFIETDNPDDYGIRLYCIRISPSIVILLNGDSKTHQKAALCENCKPHFERANVLANKITQAIQQGDIEIGEDERQLTTYDDFELTL